MRESYDDTTLREAFAALAREPRSREKCPAPELLWSAIRGELEVSERKELVDHTTTCPHCAETWRMAVLLGARPPSRWRVRLAGLREVLAEAWGWLRQPAVFPVPAGGGQMLRWNRGAVASTAGALVLLVVLLVRPVVEPQYREVPTYRGGIEAQTATDTPLAREDFLLQWSGPENALLYDLKIMTEALEPVVMVEGLESPEHRLSAEDLEGLASGEHLFWRVEATLTNGEQITSRTFVCQLQ